MKNDYDCIIIGAGPTGLMLGCLLAIKGLNFIILEKRAGVSKHSRSIGIHPPSISLFQKIGLEEKLLNFGNRITTGHAYVENKFVGEISFSELNHPYPFILTVSQSITESLLETHLLSLKADCLVRNFDISGIKRLTNGFSVSINDNKKITGKYLIGCDGKNSFVREFANISFVGKPYSDTYIMGDFEDNLGNRSIAEVHLGSNGLIESFPHGKNKRRWVIKTHTLHENPEPELLVDMTRKRIGKAPDVSTNSMMSSFGVERYLAEKMYEDGVFLAGDAAHIISPIGGQGMNLGWLDSADLVNVLAAPTEQNVQNYNNKRRSKAREAANRAFFNMYMGRSGWKTPVLNIGVGLMLKTPLQKKLIKMFTMDGLQ